MERSCVVHGLHSKWNLRPVKQTWTCLLCRKQQRFERVASKNRDALLALFGKEIADKYWAMVRGGTLTSAGRKLKL
jgi:hypothetical protein